MKQSSLLLLIFISTLLHAQTITTVAGTGTIGYSGDGGPATQAQLGDLYYAYPAFDSKGNMYIAQDFNNTIRKIDKAGIITTIAGTNGVLGYTGDGGAAIKALLYHPGSMVVDKNDNLLFADQNANVIRQISPDGIITTVSGPYATQCGVGDGGALAAARFEAISAISIDDKGNLYISDYGCNAIRKVSTTGIVTTIAGGSNTASGFSGDGGPALLAQFSYPGKVAVDQAGNVYIPDVGNQRIRKVDPSGTITTIAGTGQVGYSGDGGPAINAQFDLPVSVVIDKAGNLYIGDEVSSTIRKINTAGIISTFAGTGNWGYSGDGGPAVLADIEIGEGKISIDNNDNIYFCDQQHGVIRKITNCLSATITRQSADVELCNVGNALFIIEAGNNNQYQWQVNTDSGWVDILDNSSYSGSQTASLQVKNVTAAMDHYTYRCVVSNDCGLTYSRSANLIVKTPSKPGISIRVPATQICAGTETVFTATAINGGDAPTYQWKKNGVNAGTNSPTYSNSKLQEGDVINCVLTSSDHCLLTPGATSNTLVMKVQEPVTPTLVITPSADAVCYGSPVTFTSQLQNGGNAPVYTWYKNDVVVGGNEPSYTDNTLTSTDVIWCVAGSLSSCVTAPQVASNLPFVDVTPLVTSTISIQASELAICPGHLVSFTASAINEGPAAVYQWLKNNQPVGTNSNRYTDEHINDDDVVLCRLTSNARCVANPTTESNLIPISVYKKPSVALNHTPYLCEGDKRQLDAGSFTSYLWNTGSRERNITISQTGTYSVTVTDAHGCVGSDTTSINTILSLPASFLPNDTGLCSYDKLMVKVKGTYEHYTWNTGAQSPVIEIDKPGTYILAVTDNNGCKGIDTLAVLPKQCLHGFFMPTAFTPNGDGINDLSKPVLGGKALRYQFGIYNRWGKLVYQSSTPNKGWDGTVNGIRLDAGTFIWTCLYQFEGEEPHQEKGTVVLIR